MKEDVVFKELFEGNERYTHVPLPSSVRRILKPKDKDGYILHAFIHHEKKSLGDIIDHDAMILGYDKWDCSCISRGPGLACDNDGDPNHTWENLAKELAESYPYLAVKKRDKKRKD